ncbi:C40 family peptidase [Enterococcus faecium]|uniref:C40 family peptidase n=1 Tax=Enterococcus faecium TaxID=1352 RepID=UPI001E4AEBBA|nr:NlpC/P60 family protein [Enterococcus faecium]MDT2357565.1 NlpC/P60 family protein [Enterococcus faecium]
MKIKRVEDKPLVIHTKQKTKIHSHEPKNATIKASNIYTVNRSPKIKEITSNKESEKARNGSSEFRKQKGKKTYRKSTIHGTDNVRERGIGKFRKNIKEANQSINVKQTNLHIAGRTGAIGVKATTDQMEGGREVQQAAYMAHEALRPVIGTASQGARIFKKKVMEQKKRRIKKVEAGKKLAKKSATKATKDVVKSTANKATKETAKRASKFAAKTATTATTTAAGSVGGPAGIAIGMAAGYASGVAIERKDTQVANRNRKLAYFLDKMKAQENQQDSIVKLMKDLITRRALLWIKTVAPMIGLVLLLLVLVVAMITIPVIAVVAVIYNSPFALFLPPLEAGDTVQTVASAYVAELNRDVNTMANDHIGYDQGQIVYVDYEGMDATPSNYYDILAVYMVKYGVGDTATIMNDTSKAWLKSVVDDMCSYTTSTGSETVTVTNEDGTTSTTTTTYLYVNVTLKSYLDMSSEYSFDSNEVEMLEEIMSPEYLSMLGWSGGGGGGDPGVCSLTESEINSILAGISNSTQKAACSFALHRVGYPYSQELRDSRNYYDCSSLAYYSWRSAGVNISNGGATTASAEGQKLDEAGQTVSFDEMQPGDLIFYSYTNNGRYKNISHVAIYVGGGKVVEARSEEYGVVYRDVPNVGSIVFIGRP